MNDAHDNAIDDKAIAEKLAQKTTAWKPEELARPAPPRDPDSQVPQRAECMHPSHYPHGYDGERKTGPCIGHEPNPERAPDLPPWISHFFPEAVIQHAGWEAVVRHVGYEGGHWLVLLEPTRQVNAEVGPSIKRSEWRRLKAQVGKKKAWAIMRERYGKD